jgi:hypothetical protein
VDWPPDPNVGAPTLDPTGIASPEIALSRVALEAHGVEFDPVPAIEGLDAPFDANEVIDLQLIKQRTAIGVREPAIGCEPNAVGLD